MPTLPAYVDAGLRERTPHGSKDFPIQYYADELALCPDHTFPLHWHPELEFLSAAAGRSSCRPTAWRWSWSPASASS